MLFIIIKKTNNTFVKKSILVHKQSASFVDVYCFNNWNFVTEHLK